MCERFALITLSTRSVLVLLVALVSDYAAQLLIEARGLAGVAARCAADGSFVDDNDDDNKSANETESLSKSESAIKRKSANEGESVGATYYALVYAAFGRRAARVSEMAVVALLLGACTGYVSIVGEVLQHVIGAPASSPLALAWFIELVLLVGCMLPLSMLPSIDKLTFTSVIAVGGILFLVVCILVKAAANLGQALSDEDDKVLELATWSQGIFASLPIITFAFTMHIQLGHVWGDLRDPTPRRIGRVLHGAMAICALIYLTVGAAGYLTWFDLTNENILTNYDSDLVIEIGKTGYATMVCFSFPLMMFPARVAVAQQLRQLLPARYSINRSRETGWQRFAVALALCSFCYIVAVSLANIQVIFGLTGAVFGSYLVFVTPAAVALKLEDAVHGRAYMWRHAWPKLLLLALGVVVGSLGVVTQFIGTPD